MRRPIIAGNWKMNKTQSDTIKLLEDLIPLVKDSDIDVVVCPPFVNLLTAKEVLDGTNVKLGAQNMHFENSGAYTGEISPEMLKAIGVEYVILGHSERRQYFKETDKLINTKVLAAIDNGLIPIICVGETLEQREQGITEELVALQTKIALKGVSSEDAKKMVIAYEPVWAIGTGKTSSSEDANDVISTIRETISNIYSEDVADAIRIQYGGSANPSNISELMSMAHIDGGLIGGASLAAEDFAKIVNY